MTDRRSSVLHRLLEHWQLVLAVVTGLVYGLVYLTYSIFYSRFGLSLHDVGLGLADLAVPTVILLVFLTVLWVLALSLWWTIGLDIARQVHAIPFVRRRREAAAAGRGEGAAPTSSASDWVLRGLLLLAVLIVLATMPLTAASDAGDAAEGQPVTPGFGSLTRWNAQWAVPADRPADETCLLYLGRDGSVGAFWDAEEQRTLLLEVSGTTLYKVDRPPSSVCRTPR